MPLDFPASPTNGQTYGNYLYDSSITAWRNVNSETGISTLNAVGLKNVVPTSIAVGSGSATVNANGVVTFTGATTVSLNGCFTSTYKDYRIIISGSLVSNVSGTPLNMRLRLAGTDAVATSYYGQGVVQQASSTPVASTWASQTYNPITNMYTNAYAMSVIDITSPYEATRTLQTENSYGYSGTGGFYVAHSSLHDLATAYDGFTLLTGTGATTTGTVKVYGYTN